MKKIIKTVSLLTLALALVMAQAALAEPSEALKGVFDALVAEGSEYSANKAMYQEYFPDIAYEETLNADGFTIAVTGSEYMDGSWTYTQDGDRLTTTLSDEDMGGTMLMMQVVRAVGDYYGMNTSLLNGYIFGLSALGIESDDISMKHDEAKGTMDVSISIAGPYEMKELDQMVLTGVVLAAGPLTEESTSVTGNVGKIMMIANGNVDDLTILLGENGGLDDLAYRSIVNVVSALQPKGWENFVANYTELADAEGEGYTVALNVDEATVKEIIEDPREGDSFALIHIGG